jgi:guanylate kinase
LSCPLSVKRSLSASTEGGMIKMLMIYEINNNNDFIESACVFDNYYGSAKQTLKDLLAQNQDVILEIDWQGARQVYAKASLLLVLSNKGFK